MRPAIALAIAAAIAAANAFGSATAAFAATPDETLAAAQKRLAGLESRTARQQAVRDIENLQRIYGYYLDRGQWDQVADLFASNGTLEAAQRGVYVGKARIRKALEDMYGPPGLRQGHLDDHLQLQVLVTVAPDGRTATARARELRLAGDVGGSSSWSVGTHENRFVKQNGVWKFQALHLFVDMATDYTKGWGKDAKPIETVSATLPPDRPPTVKYEAYPKARVVPFSFKNPVTGKPAQYSGTTPK